MNFKSSTNALLRHRFIAIFTISGIATLPAQTLFVGNVGNGIVTAFDPTTSALVGDWVVGFAAPHAMAVSNTTLLTASSSFSVVSSWSATTAQTPLNIPFTGSPDSGLNSPYGITSDGSIAYVANSGSATIERYDVSTGFRIGSNFISGLSSPRDVVVSSGNLFVANYDSNTGTGTVGKYSVGDGSTINADFAIGFVSPTGLAISNGILYVADSATNIVSTFDATTGELINPFFISGLSNPQDILIHGGALFVANYDTNSIGKYNATNGEEISSNFITGPNLNNPAGLAIYDPTPIPEPSTFSAIFGALALFKAALGRRRNRSA